MVRDILKYGDPRLVRPSEPVTEFTDELRRLVEDMFETMYAARGVGLAAPQIGVNRRLFVMDCSGGRDAAERVVLINPEILATEGEVVEEEGCLSLPGLYAKVARPYRVLARGLDLDQREITLEVTGLAARCVCHEVDHLDGRLYISRLSPLKRDLLERKIRKMIKSGEW
ncbi:Peptide deformylase [bacterium HR10]|uniref:Peptide deformylase n=1 Tax=uncultured Acidobacteriota bacterium TaxID=171953 RepID=H5SCK1_9BACT|nr:peptide deformylase [uncultured Acidobacteriota bacterium]BAL54616.1 peptide deformylase [uncultured Acidobacteriota bacterium]GBC82640.1 Peptide deformylase [bacterium HR10]